MLNGILLVHAEKHHHECKLVLELQIGRCLHTIDLLRMHLCYTVENNI